MVSNWAAIRGESAGCDHYCLAPSHYWTRQDIRKRKHYQTAGCNDCLTICCCPFLSIVQEAREIKLCPPPQSDYYFGRGQQQQTQQSPVVNISLQSPPPGYAAPPPEYAAPAEPPKHEIQQQQFTDEQEKLKQEEQ